MGDVALQFVLVLATSIWMGGLVTIAVVARVASRTLSAADRVTFFRDLGRTYGVVGGLALVTALIAGAMSLDVQPLDWPAIAGLAVATALVSVTVVGIAQARSMTELRLRAAVGADDPQVRDAVRRGAMKATVLRLLIGVLSVVLLFLGVLAGS
jgi:uncharacterized membrane protein